MLNRSHRFHGHNSLNWAYRQGKTVRDNKLSLRYVINPKHSGYRVAVVVSRKVNKSAVVRNRIRRRIYECVRQEVDDTTNSFDLVFLVYSDELASLAATELSVLVKQLLKRAGTVH